MSASFLLAVCASPRTADGQGARYTPELIATLKQRVADMTTGQLDEVINYNCWDDDDGDEGQNCYDFARSQLCGYIDEIFDGGPWGDFGDVTLDGRDWLITGGLSHGDTPTDSFDAICALDLSRITQDPVPDIPAPSIQGAS